MATVIHLDTHVVAWLYAGEVERIPAALRARMNREELVVSPMVILELQYLFEVGKTKQPASTVMEALAREIGLKVSDLPFESVVLNALAADFTRDPFDRLIVSDAALADAPLATKDRALHQHYGRAVWD